MKTNSDVIEILTKVYGYVNRLKIDLTINEDNAWNTLNELSEYLVSIDIVAPLKISDTVSKSCTCNPYQLENYGCQCGAENV